VYYYTKCALLKASCATLKWKVCNIKFLYNESKYKLYIISCKTAANPLKITVLNKKLVGFRSFAPDPYRGLCPLNPRWGLRRRLPL